VGNEFDCFTWMIYEVELNCDGTRWLRHWHAVSSKRWNVCNLEMVQVGLFWLAFSRPTRCWLTSFGVAISPSTWFIFIDFWWSNSFQMQSNYARKNLSFWHAVDTKATELIRQFIINVHGTIFWVFFDGQYPLRCSVEFSCSVSTFRLNKETVQTRIWPWYFQQKPTKGIFLNLFSKWKFSERAPRYGFCQHK